MLQLLAAFPEALEDVGEAHLAKLGVLLEPLDEEALDAVCDRAPYGHARLDRGGLREPCCSVGGRGIPDQLVTCRNMGERHVHGGDCRLLCCGVNERDLAHERVVGSAEKLRELESEV